MKHFIPEFGGVRAEGRLERVNLDISMPKMSPTWSSPTSVTNLAKPSRPTVVVPDLPKPKCPALAGIVDNGNPFPRPTQCFGPRHQTVLQACRLLMVENLLDRGLPHIHDSQAL